MRELDILTGLILGHFYFLLGCMLFMMPLRRRPFFALRAAACGLASYGLFFLFLTPPSDSLLFYSLPYIFFWASGVFFTLGCCECGIREAVFCAVCAYALQHIASTAYLLLDYLIWGGRSWHLALQGVIYGVLWLLVWRVIIRRAKPWQIPLSQSISGVMVILPISIVFSAVIDHAEFSGQGGQILMLRGYDLICSVFALYFLLSVQRWLESQQELTAIRQMWQVRRNQLIEEQETMRRIDQRCHDLKYHMQAIQDLGAEGRVSEKLSEMAGLIARYDASAQTGNEALDAVLTKTALTCEARGIGWTCMADGSGLGGLDPVDLYAMMGNALDNAIEAVQRLEDPQKRIVDVTVRPCGQMVLLQVENYSKEPEFSEDGLPRTSKADPNVHGFGTRSIRDIAESYGGTLTLDYQQGIFTLRILLPLRP